MTTQNLSVFLISILLLSACGDDDSGDASIDATADSAVDASLDATLDVNSDTTEDATPDQTIPDAEPPADPLAGIGETTLIDNGYMFLEGPRYRMSDNALYFSDIPANIIYRLDSNGDIAPFKTEQPTNGLLFDEMDRLLVATHSGREVVRFEDDGTESTLAIVVGGMRLNSPNDMVLHPTNGNLYFTDPPYGINIADSERDCSGIYRIDNDVDGTIYTLSCEGLNTRPNGIGLSPDGTKLYVAFTHNGEISSWDVRADAHVENQQLFASTTGGADGMAVDENGNLYVTSNTGVEVFAPDGTKWGTILVPEVPANCAFGGVDKKTLYVTARQGLYSVELAVAGIL